MLNLNKVFVIGNLTRDPEKSVTRNNNPVCTMSVAVNRKVKDGDAVCFFDVTAWGELGCTCVKFLKKGDPVFIEGHMSQDRWIDQTTGKEKSKLWLVAESVQFLNRKKPMNEQVPQVPYGVNWNPGE